MNLEEEFLLKIAPRDMMKRTYLFVIFWFILIVVISIIVGSLISSIFIFNTETLLWMTSTLIQTFGALIAIIVAISIYQVSSVSSEYKEFKNTTIGRLIGIIAEKGKLSEKDRGPVYSLLKMEFQRLEDSRKRMFCIVAPMIILVGISIILLFFTKTSIAISFSTDSNIQMSIALTFLVLYSLFCLSLILYEIYALLDWKRRIM